MTTRPRESMSGKAEKSGVSPMGSSTPTTERRRSLPPSTPPGTTTAKDHGRASATSSTTGKHVPNYLKPTISSNLDAAKHSVIKKHARDDTHKPTPTMMRRRSFDKPVPASQVHKALQSSGSRSERTNPPFSPKNSTTSTRPGASSSSDRISKVIKALKSQPPLLKTKNMLRTNSSSGAKKETKTSSSKKATPTIEEESVLAPKTVEHDAVDKESLDDNVEEELAKLESPGDLPSEPHFADDKEHIDEEKHKLEEYVDEHKETLLDPIDTNVSEDQQVKHTSEQVAENIENVKVTKAPAEKIQDVQESQQSIQAEEIQDVQESQQSIQAEEIHNVQESQQSIQAEEIHNVQESQQSIQAEGLQDVQESQCMLKSDQQSNHAINEALAEDDDTKAEEKDTSEEEKEKEAIEEIKPVGLTVNTTPDKTDEVAIEEEHREHDSEEANKGQISEESECKISEDEKVASSEAENVVHKLQVGETKNKKECPAYNDIIEETASKLVEKRINKVRALAGAFETVISLQQPDSS